MQHLTLIEKLGYQPNEAVDTLNAPEWFLEYLRGNGVHTHAKLPTEWLHIFMTKHSHLEHFLRGLKFNEIQKGFWISWPKTSGESNDLTEQNIREALTPYNWTIAKTTDIDDEWSAIEFISKDKRAPN